MRRRRGRNREVWESLGRVDPDWAVLTDPERRSGGWDDDLDRFYESGRVEVAEVMAALPEDAGRDRALDWGSGTGRLTFALAEKFTEVTAVDVSRSMLATLAERAAARGITNVRGVTVDELRPAGDNDVALSMLVLQHLADRAGVLSALATIVGCLRVGGYAVVEVPDRALTLKARAQPRFRAYQTLRLVGASPSWLHSHGLSGISMVCVRQATVRRALAAAGASVERATVVRPGDSHRYVRYVARRTR